MAQWQGCRGRTLSKRAAARPKPAQYTTRLGALIFVSASVENPQSSITTSTTAPTFILKYQHHGRQEGTRARDRYVQTASHLLGTPVVGCRYPAIWVPDWILYLTTKSQQLSEYALTFFSTDYTLNNPDTLTKYKSAAQISQKVLDAVTQLCVAGEKIVTICEKGDKLLDEEVSKVYRGKKIPKGARFEPSYRPGARLTNSQASPTQLPSPHLLLSHHTPHLPRTRPKLQSLSRRGRLSRFNLVPRLMALVQ